MRRWPPCTGTSTGRRRGRSCRSPASWTPTAPAARWSMPADPAEGRRSSPAAHWLGLPGLLTPFDLRARGRPLTVRGPRGLRELMKVMRVVYGRVRYELTIEEVEPGAEVRRDGYTLAAVAVEHRVPALAW